MNQEQNERGGDPTQKHSQHPNLHSINYVVRHIEISWAYIKMKPIAEGLHKVATVQQEIPLIAFY